MLRSVSLLLLLVVVAMASSSFTANLPMAADDDASALLAFKAAAVGGGDYGTLASWNGSTGMCSWEGVTCHRRRVVALRLPSYGLAGMLSPAVGNLSSLRTLNLSSNWLRGGIPASLGLLRHLRTLDLSVNALSSALPHNLTSCISLTTLAVNSNKLIGAIPAELGDTLMRLHLLALDNNSFTGPIPASLANLTSLRYLNLRINSLNGAIPGDLGRRMPQLRFLDVCKNNLSGTLPPSLYNMSSLREFDVAMNTLHGTIPADIDKKLPRVEFFALFYNQFGGAIPPSISNLTALENLQLAGNRFHGSVPSDLGKSRALRILLLDGNQLGAGAGENGGHEEEGWGFIISLANCSQLQRLGISDNSFTGQLPASLANLSVTLQELYLDDNRISGSIPSDIGNLVGLRVLQIIGTWVSGSIPESIGKLANLTDLGLYNNSLSGPIPSSVGNLTKLIKLFAQHNSLEGQIPASLGKLSSLFALDLSRNRLDGSIPKEIMELPSLSWYLNLSRNSLSGPIPPEVGRLANLNALSLSGNRLSGEVPSSIRDCVVLEVLLLDDNSLQGSVPQSLGDIKGLRVLNLTMNRLSGTIPDAIGSIRNLQELYLAHNNLSGPIPAVLQNLTLSELDVSSNNLQGEVPKEGAFFGNLTRSSIAGNDELCGGAPQLHLALCAFHRATKNRGWSSRHLALALATTGGVILCVVLALSLFTWLMCKKKKEGSKTGELLSPDSPPIIEELFERVSYKALSNGTDAFSEENLLGKGSYGVVYRCNFHGKGTMVAVKVFNLEQSGSARSFVAECKALRRVRHHCLVKIITCCSSINHQGQEFKALVFEYMPNGNLNTWLHPKSAMLTKSNTLSLAQRMDIAVDIMDAMDYLHNHCQPPIVHCDLKPSNILLAQDMSARVGDFGISRILPERASKTLQDSNSTIGIRGSIGYVAPEYGEGCVASTLGDVYSLGILLLELFTGRSPTGDMFSDSMDLRGFSEAAATAPHARILEITDPAILLHDTTDDGTARSRVQECLVSVVRLGLSCSKKRPGERMPIQDAATEMRAIRDANLMFLGPLVVEHGGEEREAWMLH